MTTLPKHPVQTKKKKKKRLHPSQFGGGWPARPLSEGCTDCGSLADADGAMERGTASTTYDTPSSEAYDGGLGPVVGREAGA